jgi:uncharacterized HAD superfamily protein
MKKIGIDLDGILAPIRFLNPSLKLPQWLYLPLAFLSLFFPPNFVNRKILQSLSENNEIIIISARPKWFESPTKLWLKWYRIPYDKIYCVGFGKGTKERKLEVIKKEGISIYIEDDKRIIQFLNRHSIKVLTI